MNNQPNNPPSNQPTPLPPPQQPPPQQQYHYPQQPPPYPYTTPYYYPYYNTYPQSHPPPPPQHHTHPPHPPPPNPYYNPYYNPYTQTNISNGPPPPPPPPTWNINPNNPPPPPPKPLISPNHNNNNNGQWNNKPMVSYNNNPPKCDSTHPQSLTMYIEKCWNRFKSLPKYLSNNENKDKLQKQLKDRVQQSKSNKTLFTIDWKNEPFPIHLRHLIQISSKSNIISPKKRKAECGWNDNNQSRKIAKTSIGNGANVRIDNITSEFVNKSDSDMSCSESDSSPINKIHNHNNGNINFQIQRNNKINSKIKFKNVFKIDNISDTSDTNESEEEEAYVFTKGRGFITKKIKKKKYKNKNKKKNKKKKKQSFSWNEMNGIESLNTNHKNKNKHNNNNCNDNMEIDRILERKKRFEQQQKEINNNNNNKICKQRHNNNNMNTSHLSSDMKQLIDWHSKRVIGTNTRIEKDYFRLTSEPNPSEVRTLSTLQKAFDLLSIRWKTKNKSQNGTTNNKCDYLYVCGQFKSLRQDLRVQHIRNKFSILVYECNARICLEVGDLSEYNQCQGQLKELYIENDEIENNNSNYIEFLSYRLLYEAVTKNFQTVSNIIKIEKNNIKNNKQIRNILNIINAIQTINYYKFFKLYKKLTYYGQCILNQIIYKIRYQTLNRIILSYSPSTYPIEKLINIIGFNNKNECIKYLKNIGAIIIKKNLLNCKASRGKIKEFIPKSEDDQLGVTHGSVYHTKNQDETSIVKFLRKI